MKPRQMFSPRALSVLLFLLFLLLVTLPSGAQRTTLHKVLNAEWVEQYAHPLHWFMEQHARVPNVTSHFRLLAQTAGMELSDDGGDAGGGDYAEHKAHGRYVVARLSGLSRAERRVARRLLAEHGAEAHAIDDAHVLLFLDAASPARLRASPRTAPLAAVSVLDVYAGRLKLSRELRLALRGPRARWPHGLSRGGVVLDARTAAGHEAFAAAALRRAAPPRGCRWAIRAQRPGSGLVRVALRGEGGGGDRARAALQHCRAIIDAAAQHPAVRWVEPAVMSAAPLNYHATALVQSGVQKSENTALRPLWDVGINGSGEIVAMADSGVDFDSCFFRDSNESVALFPKTNERHRKVISYYPFDILPEKYFVGDRVGGHGTHVAGTAVGQVSGSESHHDGVAKGAKLFFRSLSYPEERQLLMPQDLTEVFRPGYSLGARVFSNSWGFRIPREYTGLEKILDTYANEYWDAVLLFAAGNAPRAGLLFPCRGKNIFCIGSHMNTFDPARRDIISHFESHGPTFDGRVKPELVSAGQSVVSAYSDQNLFSQQCSTVSKRGTSMATAVVAGAVALLRQHLRTLEGYATPSAALVKALIVHSSAYLNNWELSGFGRLDLSIFFTPTGVRGWFRDNETVSHRSTNVYCFTAGPVATPELDLVKVSLAWTDVGLALEGSLRALINDLDLVVVDSTGAVHLARGTSRDNTNVIEQIRLPPSPELAAGFRVFVYGENVHDVGTQHYALVVSAPNLQYYANCSSSTSSSSNNNNNNNKMNDSGKKQNTNSSNPTFPRNAMCAGNCSEAQGGGVCRNGKCICNAGRRFVDCSLCDEEHLCNGHGTCSSNNSSCICDNKNFADSACLTCKPGWYGPSCLSNCSCSGRGKCVDKAAGKCVCERNTTIGGSGCFDGPNCEFCCKGFAGPSCNERSYWCEDGGQAVYVEEPSAYIQINGYGKYAYYFTCRWDIEAPAEYTVRIEYLNFDVDSGGDALLVYDAKKDEVNPVRNDKGVVAPGTTFASSSNKVTLFFVSRWGRVRHGFLLRYAFVAPPGANCTEPCATGAMCSVLARGFCLCLHGRSGFLCERTVSSSSSSSSSTSAVVVDSALDVRESQVTRLPLLVNERVAVTPLRLRSPFGTDTHLFVALPRGFFATAHRNTYALLINVSTTRADGAHASATEHVVLGDNCDFVHIVVGAALRDENETPVNRDSVADMRVVTTLLHSATQSSRSGEASVVTAVQVSYEKPSASQHLEIHCRSKPPGGLTPVAFGDVKSLGHEIAPNGFPRELHRDRAVYLLAAALALVTGTVMGAAAYMYWPVHGTAHVGAPAESDSEIYDPLSSLHPFPLRTRNGNRGGLYRRSGEHAYIQVNNDLDSDSEGVVYRKTEVLENKENPKGREDPDGLVMIEDVEMDEREDALK